MDMRLALCTLLTALSAAAGPRVVATTADLGAIAREVAGPDAAVAVLAHPSQDPHYVDARPDLKIHLNRADLLVLTGLDLEAGWLPVLLTDARNARIQKGTPGYLDASTLVVPKEVPRERVDRSQGDIHPGGNPHYTKDPRNGVLIAKGIAERLAQLDPEHAQGYRARASAFADRMAHLIAEWEKRLAPMRGQPVVTHHKSWTYFTDWAGLEVVATLEPKPGIDPSPRDLLGVVKTVRDRKVPAVLQEEWYPKAAAEKVADLGRSRLARVPGMPKNGDYAEWIGQLVDAVAGPAAEVRGRAAPR